MILSDVGYRVGLTQSRPECPKSRPAAKGSHTVKLVPPAGEARVAMACFKRLSASFRAPRPSSTSRQFGPFQRFVSLGRLMSEA
jgi:hypothetical protein